MDFHTSPVPIDTSQNSEPILLAPMITIGYREVLGLCSVKELSLLSGINRSIILCDQQKLHF